MMLFSVVLAAFVSAVSLHFGAMLARIEHATFGKALKAAVLGGLASMPT